MRRSNSKPEKFHFKNKFIYSDNPAIIRAREKRQTALQNMKTIEYEKTKTNDRQTKKTVLKKLYENERFLAMFIDEQKLMKI